VSPTELTLSLPTAADTQAAAKALASVLRAGDLLLLIGELGAGKTTFTQGLGEGLGVRGGIISPTFVLARVHPSLVGGPELVHVDAYRLGSAGELEDLDLADTMDRAVTVVEWGRDRAEGLAESRLEIELVRPVGGALEAGAPAPWESEELEDDAVERTLTLRAVGPRWDAAATAALAAALGLSAGQSS
jgi:tRNA threonylcarbamoyl adenosine modification protein YjeE